MPTPIAPEFARLRPGLWTWHVFNHSVKAELFSTALAADRRIYIVDPIPLAEPDFGELNQAGEIAGVIVTNANHQRFALEYSDRFSVPVFAHPDALTAIKPTRSGRFSAVTLQADLEVIEIEGAVLGEIALYHSAKGGTLIVGDALINFDPYGFTFLPRKYCLDQKQMRRSLGKLLSLSIDRMLFAHGTPILSKAADHLRDLLESKIR
jgi:glyoxylase-like metal-dependent hydrolase (beta-lactamase superfamily II)